MAGFVKSEGVRATSRVDWVNSREGRRGLFMRGHSVVYPVGFAVSLILVANLRYSS
ncbi:hypothetical protein K440DRAFT_634114 [Wilcoxina mikolae CBS 423.85]|nr:hypothetical protein K440DRAFT_634114 [Wilcoxina mikolae CBS 423.85]